LWERPTIEELAVFINDPHKNVQKYHMYIEIGSRYTNLPLSFNQQRRWFFGQAKTTRDFPTNIYSAIRLIGKLNVRIIEQVFNEIVCRHEVLRTNFISSGGNSIQVVRSQSMLSVPIEDIKGLDKQDSEKNARKCAIQEFKRPFDLTKDTPIRLKLLKIDDQEYIILLIVEHIVFDGWSMNIFLNEFSLLYNSFIMDQPSPLPEQSIQYSDFVLWQQKQLTGRYFESLRNYWDKQLDGASPLLKSSKFQTRTLNGRMKTFLLRKSLFKAVKNIATANNCTLFITLLSIFKILLYKYTGKTDIAVGSPFANRINMNFNSLIGFFTNFQILRTNLSGNPTFKALLMRVYNSVIEAYFHQALPFDLTDVKSPFYKPYSPLTQIMFAIEYEDSQPLLLQNQKSKYMQFDIDIAKYVLSLVIFISKDEARGVFTYNTDLLSPEFIIIIISDLTLMLESIVENSDTKINTLVQHRKHNIGYLD
jgi:hypothetical protein